MKKCYFTEVDDQFNPAEDIVVGPWCLDGTDKVELIIPYSHDEILLMHRKLFDLSFFLLNRDLSLQLQMDESKRNVHYLLLQKDYLFFVFFAFSRFRMVKKIVSKYGEKDIVCEHVPVKLPGTFVDYFKTEVTGYLAARIFECISSSQKNKKFHKKNFFVKDEISKSHPKKKSDKKILCAQILGIKNYFRHMNGISFFSGLILTSFYKIISLVSRNNTPIQFSRYNPTIGLNEEVLEFIKVFDKLSPEFIKQYSECKKKVKIKNLYIKFPGFFLNNKVISPLIEAYLEGDTKILISQHGSCYATLQKHFHREMEYNLGRFLSWGKIITSYLERKNVIKNLPFPYLSSIADSYKYDNQKNILWLTGVHYKSGDGLEYCTGQDALKYAKKKKDFWHKLRVEVSEQILFKHLPTSSEMFLDVMLNIIPQNQQVCEQGIIPHMQASRFIFLDYYGTPFYEAMSMNAPVVLAMLEGIPFFTEEASHIFQKFEEAGVVYRTPDAAAQFLNELYYRDIKQWWNDEKIQSIRREFLEMYANNKPYFWPWLKAILKREI